MSAATTMIPMTTMDPVAEHVNVNEEHVTQTLAKEGIQLVIVWNCDLI